MTGTEIIDNASLLSQGLNYLPSPEEKSAHEEDNEEVARLEKVKWKAVILSCVSKDEGEIYTTTYAHIPPLAQEIPEEPEIPPTFLDPLRHLRLDVQTIQPAATSTASIQFQEGRKSPSVNTRFSDGVVSKIQKRFLRTPPNKYLPVPPLIRTPYFYAYGRCPMCAGNFSPMNHFNKRTTSAVGTPESNRSLTGLIKNGPLEHLAGKTQVRVDNVNRKISLNYLKDRISDVMRDSRSHIHIQRDGGEESQKLPRRNTISRPTGLFKVDIKSTQIQNRLKSFSKSSSSTGKKTTIHIDMDRFTPRYQLKPKVDDMNDVFRGEVILASKLKDHDCHIPLIGVDTEKMRELYTATILRDHVLNRLYHRKNFRNLPPDLKYLQKVNFLDFVQARSWMTIDSEIDRDRHFHLLTTNNAKSILDEISIQFFECDFAELHVFTNWLDSAKADKMLLQLQSSKEITKLYYLLGEELTRSNLGLGGTARMELLIILATAIDNRRLRHCLWSQVNAWLDPLIGGIFSTSKCVREESCYTLAYLFSMNSFVEDLRHLLTYDIPYDVTWYVLKAIDQFPDTFMTYFLLLGYMLEGCPSISILSCIIERGPLCSNHEIQKRWPLFVYYAVKHWNMMYLVVEPTFPSLLIQKMTLAAMTPMARKAAKLALVALAKKFDKPAGGVTHFNPKWLKRED